MYKTLFSHDYRGFRVSLLLDITGRASDRFIWRCEHQDGAWILQTGGRTKEEREAIQAAEDAISSRPEADAPGDHTLMEIWQALYFA